MAGIIREFTTHSAEETEEIGRQFGHQLPPNSIICLFGDLAAGKTTFVRGLSKALSNDENLTISSPTFVYLNIYDGKRKVFHFDLYRLRDSDEFLSMGFDEMLFSGEVCCLEWSERILDLLPENCIHIAIQHLAENERKITINYGISF
jgi:tRNA threonylcarbamoyladenosine biosynthesis protein TsaE